MTKRQMEELMHILDDCIALHNDLMYTDGCRREEKLMDTITGKVYNLVCSAKVADEIQCD